MNKIIKFPLRLIASVYRMIFNLNVVNRFKDLSNTLYTFWVYPEFKECGKNCLFMGFAHLVGAKYIRLGNNVIMGRNIVLEVIDKYRNQTFKPCFTMGNQSSLQDDCHVACVNQIIIGDNVRIGRKCLISDHAHGASNIELLDIDPRKRPIISRGPVIIEDCVWVGEMCCIMPGVTIGKGSIIGANAVVTKSVPPYCVVGGNPARVIKQLGC